MICFLLSKKDCGDFYEKQQLYLLHVRETVSKKDKEHFINAFSLLLICVMAILTTLRHSLRLSSCDSKHCEFPLKTAIYSENTVIYLLLL